MTTILNRYFVSPEIGEWSQNCLKFCPRGLYSPPSHIIGMFCNMTRAVAILQNRPLFRLKAKQKLVKLVRLIFSDLDFKL